MCYSIDYRSITRNNFKNYKTRTKWCVNPISHFNMPLSSPLNFPWWIKKQCMDKCMHSMTKHSGKFVFTYFYTIQYCCETVLLFHHPCYRHINAIVTKYEMCLPTSSHIFILVCLLRKDNMLRCIDQSHMPLKRHWYIFLSQRTDTISLENTKTWFSPTTSLGRKMGHYKTLFTHWWMDSSSDPIIWTYIYSLFCAVW